MSPSLSYIKTGDRPLLMFHGYGQDASVFAGIDGYSIELFFHGKSRWSKGEEPLQKEEWKQIISGFLDREKIGTFSVLGFSMGGKFALATLESFPDRVNEIILLAPDGIKSSFWYNLATYPVAFRRFFKSMIANHKRFLRVARVSKTLGLIDKGVLRFAETQMDSEEKRQRVYYSWVVFRNLKFDLKKIKDIINKNNISLKVFVGRHDKVIKAKDIKRLTSGVSNAQFEILDAGHLNVIQKAKPLISA